MSINFLYKFPEYISLVRYDPNREIRKMQKDFDKFWEDGWNLSSTLSDSSSMDIYEEDGKLVAELSLPNFDKSEIKITADDGILEVTAEHNEKVENKNKRHYYLRESNNQFFRRVALPEGVKPKSVDAEFKNGLLKISMPNTMSVKSEPKTVPIK